MARDAHCKKQIRARDAHCMKQIRAKNGANAQHTKVEEKAAIAKMSVSNFQCSKFLMDLMIQ